MKKTPEPEVLTRETIPVTSDMIAATFTNLPSNLPRISNLPEIVLLGESQAPGPPESHGTRRPSRWATVIKGLKHSVHPPDIRFGSFFSDAARKAWTSARPPALPTALYDTPGGAKADGAKISIRSTKRSNQIAVVTESQSPMPSRAWYGWYMSGVLAAALAVVSIRSYDPDSKQVVDPTPPVAAVAAPKVVEAEAPLPKLVPALVGASASAANVPVLSMQPAAIAAASGPTVPAVASTASATAPTFASETTAGRAALDSGDTAAAMEHFRSALAANPGFFPAAIGYADAKWATGRTGEAASLYRDIIEHYPPSMVPARAKERGGETVATR